MTIAAPPLTKVPNYVNGQWVESTAAEWFDVTNPADGTRYQVRPNVVNIISSSASESEPVVQYASN